MTSAGEPGELLGGGAQRGRGDLGALLLVGRVLVPEPLHAVAAQVVVGGELVVGSRVEGRVGDRVEEHLLDQGDVAAVLRHQGERGGHVAADGVADHRDTGGVQALGRALGDDPLGHCVVLLDGDGVAGLGREVVLGEDDSGLCADRQFAHQAVVGVGVAEDPARAMDVDDHRERAGGAGGADDPRPHLAGGSAGHGDPLFVDGGLGYVAGLQVVDSLAALCRGQLEQERRVRGRLGECRGGGLQDGAGAVDSVMTISSDRVPRTGSVGGPAVERRHYLIVALD